MRRWLKRLAGTDGSEQPMAAREAYDLWSASYGTGTNALQDLEREAMLSVLPDVGDRLVLDAGCGTGRWTQELRQLGAQVVGFDLSLGMLAMMPEAARSARLAAAIDRPLPFRSETFEAALCALVLGHVADLATPLSELARVLRPGGCLVISGFHPYATLQGWQRSFEYVKDGQAASGHIEQHLHLLSAYVSLFAQQGLTLEALEESLWQESPVVFALRAVKRA